MTNSNGSKIKKNERKLTARTNDIVANKKIIGPLLPEYNISKIQVNKNMILNFLNDIKSKKIAIKKTPIHLLKTIGPPPKTEILSLPMLCPSIINIFKNIKKNRIPPIQANLVTKIFILK